MPKKSDDWGLLAAGVVGAVAGAGAASASLNAKIKNLQTQILQWQRQAIQLQAERDQLAGRVAFLESQLRQSKDSESKLRAEIAELEHKIQGLASKK
jgi:septal ring factor EnvC (AmiA/AmiB activator)